VNGTVRIRGGNQGLNKVLTATDSQGHAEWSDPSSGTTPDLTVDRGLTFGAPNAATKITSLNDPDPGNTGNLSIFTQETQQRILGTCADPQAIQSVSQDGLVNCRSFVTSVITTPPSPTTGAGGFRVTTTPGTGDVQVEVDVGTPTDNGGLRIENGIVKMNVDGDRIVIDGPTNEVRLAPCANNETLKFNAATLKWECAPLIPPASGGGESVIYIKEHSSSPPYCPSLEGWLNIRSKAEPVGGGKSNGVTLCINTTKACQVIYMKTLGDSIFAPAGCPFNWRGWNLWTGSVYNGNGSSLSYSWSYWREWVPGGTLENKVRACYRCF